MMNKEKLVIIDGNSLIFRAYYAIQRPMVTKDGVYTQGIYGFLSMLSKIRTDYKPTHMLIAFDRKAPTFRHIEYAEYKAGRKKTPLELTMEFEPLKDVLHAMGIFTYEIDGFEADDILGTTAKMADEAGFPAMVVTGDRDSLQLATDNTSVLITKKGISEFKLYDDAAMQEEYGFDHVQFIDYKALRGDTSDNIPGIEGVGEKTAIKLVQEFGSLENLIANVDKVSSEKLRTRIEDGAMQAMMSKRLATIVTNVPVDYTLDDLEIREPDRDKLIELYSKLEFKTYLAKLVSEESKGAAGTEGARGDGASGAVRGTENGEIISLPMKPTEGEVILASGDDFKKFEDIQFANETVYVELVSDNNHIDKPSLEVLYALIGEKCYVFEGKEAIERALGGGKCQNAAHVETTRGGKCENAAHVEMTRSGKCEGAGSDPRGGKCEVAGFNLGKVYYALLANGIDISRLETKFDCALAQYVLNPGSKAPELETLILEAFHENVSLFDGNKSMQMSLLPEENMKVHKAVANRLVYTKALAELQKLEIQKEDLEKVFYEIELPLCKVLASMEVCGFSIDSDKLVSFGNQLKTGIAGLEKQIYELAGEEFNINSPKQLGTILFEKLELPGGKKTKTGYSTGAEVLENLADEYEIAAKVLEYRGLAKLNSTYVEGLGKLIGPDKKVHPHFQQTVTATGRISCTEPNLQNIPVRSNLGKELRKAFVAGDGKVLIGADYSQIELRVMAHMSGDKDLISCFERGLDIHKETASKVFGVPFDEVTDQMRSNAKAVNFGVIYGMSSFGLSSGLSISRKEAERYISDYFARFPMVKQFLDDQVAMCKADGFVRTLYGRKRRVLEINDRNYMVRQLGERLAMNTPIQGTAADIIKIAMVDVFEELAKKCPKSQLILQVHDELIIEADSTESEAVKQILKDSMMNAAKLAVALDVSMEEGKSWYEL